MALSFDSITSLLLVDVSLGPKTIQLPYANERSGRVLTIKDSGYCNKINYITILCAGEDKFETGSSTHRLNITNSYITIVSDPSFPGWKIVSRSEINLFQELSDVFTINLSSLNANLSTISTNNIDVNNISATNVTIRNAYLTNAHIENLSVNVLFANIVSTAITQDITAVTVDTAYISSATISSLNAYSTFISQLYVNDIRVGGATTLSNTLQVAGATTLSNTLGVAGATTLSNTLGVSQITTLASTLRVAHATSLSNTLGVAGATTLSNTLGVVGATTLSNTLGVAGATTLSNTFGVAGATTLSNTFGVAGATTLSNTLGVVGATSLSNTLGVVGATTLSNTLGVAGATTLSNTLGVSQITTLASTLNVAHATTLSNTLQVAGATTLSNTLGVAGATTLSNTLGVAGATTLSNTLGVAGATTLSNTLGVAGATTLSNTLQVAGATTLSNTLGVSQITTLASTLNVAHATTLSNTLQVAGATTLSNTLQVAGATTLSNSLQVIGNVGLNVYPSQLYNTVVGGKAAFLDSVTTFGTVTFPGPLSQTVTTFLGSTAGSTDGSIVTAKLNGPTDIAFSSDGTMYIADTSNNKIRKVTTDGIVSTVAGTGSAGFNDGDGSIATFDGPSGITVGSDGSVYVTDINTFKLRKLTFSGTVTTVSTVLTDSSLGTYGVVIDSSGNIFFSSSTGYKIKKYTLETGAYSDFAGSGVPGLVNGTGIAAQFLTPRGLTIDLNNNIYVADNYAIRKITPAGVVTTIAGSAVTGSTDGIGSNASFGSARGITYDLLGNLYVADATNNKIRKVILSTGEVTTLAGSTVGFLDGKGTGAQFSEPRGVKVDLTGNLFIADGNNHCIRKIMCPVNLTTSANYENITIPGGLSQAVTTFVGSGTRASIDGTGIGASFNYTGEMAFASDGTMYITEQSVHVIRKVTTAGVVTTFAGSGVRGSDDGQGTAATFNNPVGITISPDGTLYVADFVSGRIRKITSGGLVSTIATEGSYDVHGVVLDSTGNLFYSTYSTNKIKKITPSGTISVFAGSGVKGLVDGTGTGAQFNQPSGLTVDENNNIYVADYTAIRKITPGGVVTTIAGSATEGTLNGTGSAARFYETLGITYDFQGNIYTTELQNFLVRKVVISTGVVTTYAGSTKGYLDGVGTAAQFGGAYAVKIDPFGNLFVSDSENYRIRKISFTPSVTTKNLMNTYVTIPTIAASTMRTSTLNVAGATTLSNTLAVAGFVGIGKTNPSYPLDVNGDINFTGVINSNGSPVVFTPPGINSVGNIGINKAAGTASLDVNGDIQASATIRSGGTARFVQNGSGAVIVGASDNQISELQVYGKAGIGLATNISPACALDVNGAIRSYRNGTISSISTESGESYDNLVLRSPYGMGASGRTSIIFAGGNTNAYYARMYGFDQTNASGTWYGGLAFQTTNNGALYDRMTIDYRGNVGIGTTSPVCALDVAGTINIRTGGISFIPAQLNNLLGAPMDGLGYYNETLPGFSGYPLKFGGFFGTVLSSGNGGGLSYPYSMVVKDGMVGVGVKSPTAKFQVIGNTNTTTVGGLILPATIVNAGAPYNTIISALDYLTYNTTANVMMEIGSANSGVGDIYSVYKYLMGASFTAGNAVNGGDFIIQAASVAGSYSTYSSNTILKLNTSQLALGSGAGVTDQKINAIAIGKNAGNNTQGSHGIAIGVNAGQANQGIYTVAIGVNAGYSSQADSAVAIGSAAGQSGQLGNSVAIGTNTGQTGQKANSVAIGTNAAYSIQGANAIALGENAGRTSQGDQSIAIGIHAGSNIQGVNAIAIGSLAGQIIQGVNAIAVGVFAGYDNQKSSAIAIGASAGKTNQSTNTIAIGTHAGRDNQGGNSIAIGNLAGQTNQAANSIILNADDVALNSGTSGFFVKPIRNVQGSTSLMYNSSGEITHGTPLNPSGINSAGNIGINKAAGTVALDVNGDIQASATIRSGGTARFVQNGSGAVIVGASDNQISELQVYGKAGIGLATNISPACALDVNGAIRSYRDATFTTLGIQSGESYDNIVLRSTSNMDSFISPEVPAGKTSIVFGSSSLNGYYARIFGENQSVANSGWAGSLSFQTTQLGGSFVTAMTISKLGYVGIGTTSPNTALQVNKSVPYADLISSKFYGKLQLELTSGSGRLYLGNGYTTSGGVGSVIQSADYFNTIDNPANLYLNPLGGNVGIGTTSPETKLHVQNGSVRIFAANGTDNALTVANGILYTAPSVAICGNGSSATFTVGVVGGNSVTTIHGNTTINGVFNASISITAGTALVCGNAANPGGSLYGYNGGNAVAIKMPFGANITGDLSVGSLSPQPSSGTFTKGTIPLFYWAAIASSADASKLVTVSPYHNIYKSTDSGSTWTEVLNTYQLWNAVTSSSDGTKLAAVTNPGYIWISSDSGASWTQKAISKGWSAITSSSDGTKLAATIVNGYIYTSADSGSNWTQTSSPQLWWRSIASSSDGTKLAAVTSGGFIYISPDFGVTWVQKATSQEWTSIASSSDGTKLAAAVSNGYIWISSDSGASWTQKATSQNWTSIASSSDGTKLTAAVYNGFIFRSTDSGNTWTQTGISQQWASIDSSSDGMTVAVAGGGSGTIYTGNFEAKITITGTMTTTGNIGIGTTTPRAPLDVIGGAFISYSFGRFFLANQTGFSLLDASVSGDYMAIMTNNYVFSSKGFMAASDERIKKNIKPVTDSLDIVNSLNIVSFDYIDFSQTSVNHGLIAQEVQKVYPKAVSITKQCIPSVFNLAASYTGDVSEVTITSSVPHGFSINDMIKLYINQDDKADTSDFEYNTNVLDVISETEFVVKAWDDFALNKDIFIYGKEVNDFLAVDKPLIGVLAAGACKVLSQKVSTLEQENVDLRSTIQAILLKYPL